MSNFKREIVIYSCISGDYDQYHKDRLYIKPCDRFKTNRMNAKLAKILPHKFLPKAKWTIWADANVIFKIEAEELIKYFNYPKVGVFSHYKRNTINEEILVNNEKGLDTPRRSNMHKDKGGRLASLCVIIRQNCDEVNNLNEAWWAEISIGSSRDQVSFPYTLGSIATYKPIPHAELHSNPNTIYNNNDIFWRAAHLKKNKYNNI